MSAEITRVWPTAIVADVLLNKSDSAGICLLTVTGNTADLPLPVVAVIVAEPA